MGVAALRRCRSGRRLLRHGLAPSRAPPRPPVPVVEPAASSSAMARPRRLPLRPLLPGAELAASLPPPQPDHAGRHLLRHGQVAHWTPPPPPRPGHAPTASSSATAATGRREPHRRRRRVGTAGRWSTFRPDGLDGPSGLTVPWAGPARHGTRGISVVPGLPPRPGGPTRPGTEVHRACLVSGRARWARVGLGSDGPFGHL
jgi:hypothetical protein